MTRLVKRRWLQWFMLICLAAYARGGPEPGSDPLPGLPKVLPSKSLAAIKKMLPSQMALEEVGITFIDALIKAGQIEMAKGAFKTQLDVLKKVQPDQYKKYKNIPISRLAADAVFQQTQQQGAGQKTGNRLVDMLHENGIPIGSSLKGIQQAMKTQKEIEETDPAEQVAKAVFEKFQKQILPGLVANLIAGRNPFQAPGQPDMQTMMLNQQRMFKQQHAEAVKQFQEHALKNVPKVQDDQFDLRPLLGHTKSKSRDEEYEYVADEEEEKPDSVEESEYEDDEEEEEEQPSTSYARRDTSAASNKATTLDSFETPMRPLRAGRLRSRRQTRLQEPEEDDIPAARLEEAETGLGGKASLLLGLYEPNNEGREMDDDEEEPRRLAPLISRELAQKVLHSDRLRALLGNSQLAYTFSDPEALLEPKKVLQDPDPKPGFVTPRPLPKRPRKMLPLLVGKVAEVPGNPSNDDSEEQDEAEYADDTSAEPTTQDPPAEPFRRKPVAEAVPHRVEFEDLFPGKKSRTLRNLMNNPGIASIFDQDLVDRLSPPSVMRREQRMGANDPDIVERSFIHPMAEGGATESGRRRKPSAMDQKVKQAIEERDVPPVFFVPKGRHTRLRWTGATEREIPGLGTRMIVPSLDPTMPAINSAVSTQGKIRDEYDSTFKIPNYWSPGDSFGLEAKSVQERLIGGDGNVDFPAMQSGMMFGK